MGTLWVHFGNKNFLNYLLPSQNNGEFTLLFGRLFEDTLDYGSSLGLKGTTYTRTVDFSSFKDSTSVGYGHVYGSNYQGLDFSDEYTNENNDKGINALAAYRDTSNTFTTIKPTGSLFLYGYAQAILNDGSYYGTLNQNMQFSISRETGDIDTLSSSYIDLTSNNLSTMVYSNSGVYPTSAYINDDFFAALSDDAGWLVAIGDETQTDDYISWGWFSNNAGDLIVQSPWVAGTYNGEAVSYINSLFPTTTLQYDGKNMGFASYGGNAYYIDPKDSSNKAHLEFEIGSEFPVTNNSYLEFKVNEVNWHLPISDSSTLIDGVFSSSFDTADVSSGDIVGSFYGPIAQSIGGAFNFTTDINTTVLPASATAIGVFKGSQSSILIADNYFALSGFATSTYVDDNNATLFSVADDLELSMENGDTITGTLALNDVNTSLPRYTMFLDAATINSVSDMQHFSLGDFDSNGTTLYTYNDTSSNDYVSWGYWSSNEVNTTTNLLQAKSDNLWVAGKDSQSAKIYIDTLAALSTKTTYTYTGQILGSVSCSLDNTHIDNILPTDPTNKLQLTFDFGAGTNSINTAQSWLKFTADSKLWHLVPSATSVSGNGFATTITQGDTMDGSLGSVTGQLQGKFYGVQAQAIGGTFEAQSDQNIRAIGVFKGLR